MAVAPVRSSLPTPPAEFGNKSYVLKDELGHGASGRVFECKKKDSSMLYAVKTLHLRSLRLRKTAERDLKRLGRELKILKELPPHPRIVQMVDSFEEGDWFFMVLELVRGGDLGRALRERRPSRLLESEAAFVFWQLVEGIGFLHGRNIIHRDLKLENVLISDRHREGKAIKYNVKISDFGLSKAVSSVLPEVHSVVGTQRYVAPEVLGVQNQGAYDFRVDLWSLGVLTFVLLTGGYPTCQSQQVLDEAVGKISSESARLILKGLLQLDPQQRFTLQDLQAHSWHTGDEDVIMLPPATQNGTANGVVPVVGASDSSPTCSDYDWLARCPPAPLHSVNDPSLLSGLPLEPEPEPGRLSILPMSFLEGMEEELRRPFEKPPPREPVVSKEQMSSSSWQRSAAKAGEAEMHLHVTVPKRADGTCLVGEETLKELSTSSGCNVWTLPPEGPNDAYHVVMVGSCSQCAIAQQMLADFLYRQEGGQKSFTVIMFLPSEVHLNERDMDDVQQRSHSTVEPLEEQEGKRPWIITGTLVQVLEAERLLYTGHKRRKVTSPGGAST